MLSEGDVPELLIKPSKATLWLLGVAVSFGIVVGILTFISDSGVIYGLIMFFGAIFIWLYVGSLRIALYSDRLEMKRFWLRTLSVPVSDVLVRDGRAGDFAVIPAVLFVDRKTGRRIGAALKSQFKASDLDMLTEAIHARGGAVNSPSSRSKDK